MNSNNSASPYDSYPFKSNPENPCEAEKRAEAMLDFLDSQLPEGLTGEERVAKWQELQLQYGDMMNNDMLDQIPAKELAFHQAEAAAHPDGLSAQLLRMGPVLHHWESLEPLMAHFQDTLSQIAAKKRSAEKTLEHLKQDFASEAYFELTKSQEGAILAWHQAEAVAHPQGRAAQLLKTIESMMENRDDLYAYERAYEYLCTLKSSKNMRAKWHN